MEGGKDTYNLDETTPALRRVHRQIGETEFNQLNTASIKETHSNRSVQ